MRTPDALTRELRSGGGSGVGIQPAGTGLIRRLSPADWRVGVAVGTALAAAYGAVFALLLPRGPVTSPQALSALAFSILLGFLAGVVMRSRWALVVAPVVFAVAFELVRLDASGPTVDGIHPSSTYGVMAVVVGRGSWRS